MKNRFFKPYVIVLVFVLCALSFLPLLGNRLVNTARVRAWIVGQVENATGGKIDFRSVSISILPQTAISLHKLRFQKSGYGQAIIEKLEIEPNLLSIVRTKPRLKRISLVGPEVRTKLVPRQGNYATNINFQAFIKQAAVVINEKCKELPEIDVHVSRGSLFLANGSRPPVVLRSVRLKATLAPGKIKLVIRARSAFTSELSCNLVLDTENLKGRILLGCKGLVPEIAMKMFSYKPLPIQRGLGDFDLQVDIQGPDSFTAGLKLLARKLVFGRGKEKYTAENLKATIRAVMLPEKFELELVGLDAKKPAISASADLFRNKDSNQDRFGFYAHVGKLEVADFHQILKATGGLRSPLKELFAIVKSGQVSAMNLSSQAGSWEKLWNLAGLKLEAAIQDALVVIPFMNWRLEDVSAKVGLSSGLLNGENITARWVNTYASQGRLQLDLGAETAKFNLACDLDADLGQLPGVLKDFVASPRFLSELDRIRDLKGKARGRLQIEYKPENFSIKVKVSNLDLEADYNRLPDRLRLTQGRITYDGNLVRFSHVIGSLGPSIVKNLQGSIDWRQRPEIIIDKACLRLNCSQVYDWLYLAAKNMRPGLDIQAVRGWIDVTALKIRGFLDDPFNWSLQFMASLDSLQIESRILPAVLDFARGKLNFDSGKLAFSDVAFAVGETQVNGFGEISLDSGKPRGNLSLKGHVDPLLQDWIVREFDLPDKVRATQPIKIDELELWLESKIMRVNAQGRVAGDVKIGLAMELGPTCLKLEKLLLEDSLSRAAISLYHPFDSRYWLIDFNGNLVKSTLNKIWILDPDFDAELTGKFAMVLDMDRPEASGFLGYLKIGKLMLPWGRLKGIRVEQALLTGSGKKVVLCKARMNWLGDKFDIEGHAVIRQNLLYLDLETTAAVVHADRIQSSLLNPRFQAESGEQKHKERPFPLKAVVELNIGQLIYGKHVWAPFQSIATLKDRKFDIRLIKAKVCGISIAGNIGILGKGVSVDLAPATVAANIQYTMGCLAGNGSSERIEGTLAVSGRVTTRGVRQEELLKRLKGRIDIEITDGKIYNAGQAGLFTNIFAYLKINRLVTGDLPDLRRDEMPFQSIKIEINFDGGKLILQQAMIKAKYINIVGGGVVDLLNQEMNLTMLVSPLKSLDWIISHTPIVGKILKGTLIAIPVGVQGAMDDPQVIPLAPRAVGNRILGILERILRAPFELIQPVLPGIAPKSDTGTDEQLPDGSGH